MAEKKNQHLVPEIYLKEFSFITLKKDKEGNEIKSINIYVNHKNKIEDGRSKGLKNKIFVKSYFYNIKTVDSGSPLIENNLSKIEGRYKKVLQKLISNNFDLYDILYISNFTLLQFQRVPKFINNFQSTFNDIANMMNKISNNNIYSDIFNDIAKKMLLDYEIDNMYKTNLVYEQGIYFLENNTNIPFITSDSPVVHKMLYKDELKNIFKDINLIYSDHLLNNQLVFFFFPLTPTFALISTKLIMQQNNYIKVDNSHTISLLNYFTYNNSNDNIYSNKRFSYKDFFDLRENEKVFFNNLGYWAQVITYKDRYNIKLLKFENESYFIKLYLEDNQNIDNILNDKILNEINIYYNQTQRQHNKKIMVNYYDKENNILIIENELKFLYTKN